MSKTDWNKYFRNQGFGAKKLIEAYGVGGWRAAFAKSVILSRNKYGDRMVVEAREYLNAWRSGIVDHRNDTFSIKVLYGNKKVYTKGFEKKLAEIKQKRLSLANTKANRPIKADLRRLEREFKKESGISAAKEAIARYKQGYKFDPLFKEKRQDNINKRLEEALAYGFKEYKLAQDMTRYQTTQMDLMDSKYEGRDIGVAIGEGDVEERYPEEVIEKILAMLKRGKKFSATWWKGVNESELGDILRKRMGTETYEKMYTGSNPTNLMKELRKYRVGQDEKMFHKFRRSKWDNLRQQYMKKKAAEATKKK